MKKFYSLVLMAAALLIGTNAWADVTTKDQLQQAIDNAGLKKDVGTVTITLGSDITIPENSCIWLGTNGVDDDVKSINLDLKGFNIKMESTGTSDARYMFVVSHGELLVTNSASAKSQLILKGNTHKNSAIFYVYGSYKSSRWTTDADGNYVAQEDESKIINTRNEGYFSHVEIGTNVELYADGCNGTGIVIDAIQTGTAAYKYGPKVLSGKYLTDFYDGSYGLAQGVRVDIKGDIDFSNVTTSASGEIKSYGIKLNGLVWNPLDTEKKKLDSSFGTDAKYLSHYTANRASHTADTIDAPYIHIHRGAHLKSSTVTTGATDNSTAVYIAGYGKVRIDGAICEGNTALYASSGAVEVNDATLHSTATEYTTPAAGGHANGGGSTLVLNSRDSYGGGINITITGDTKITSDAGYAIESRNNTSTDSTKVEGLHIESATIEGGDMGAIIIEPKDDNKSTIVVANITGQVSSTDPTQPVTLEDLVSGEHHTVEVNGVTVVTPGAAPAATDWTTIEGNQGADKDYSWSVAEAAVIGDGTAATKVTLGNLEMNAGTSGNLQSITIKNNATLEANYIMMNDYARIIVEAGGTLIVKGANGIYSNKVENIVLKTSETAQATFLFNPAVRSNRHPNATVELQSKAFRDGSKWVYQRFGMPTHNGKVAMTPKNEGAVRSFVKTWDYVADDWSAWTEITGGHSYTDATPFQGFMLGSTNEKSAPMTYEFAGELVGNDNANLHFYYGWNNYANSYVAPVNITEFIKTVNNTVGSNAILATIYMYQDLGNDTYTWQPVNLSNAGKQKVVGLDANHQPIIESYPAEIKPMQAFLMQLRAAGTTFDQAINYEKNVYNPALGISNNAAPARDRRINSEMSVAIYNAEGYDNISLIENDQFSSDLDNGYDAVKYMNTANVKLYAMNYEEPMSIMATDNVEGTFVGVDAPKAGNYTLFFYGINGMDYAVVDMQTGVVVNVEEGAKYDFFTEAGRNDYRFQIVEASKVPTAIDNTEVKANVNGIYTITGQYVGEDFNVLPKGLYIVNGVKVIK